VQRLVFDKAALLSRRAACRVFSRLRGFGGIGIAEFRLKR
jgi:hypothetical protein